jgi:DNA-binding transcriptional LysR family regulator
LELKHLHSFVAVAEQLSFVRAAQRLHLSQPALSGQIQALEDDLGVKLLFRNRRVVQLTDAGKVFLNEAYAILQRTQQAAELAQKAAKGQIGKLSIGFVSSAALEIVPDIVVAFRRNFPDVTLDLRNIRTADQIEGLAGKNLDIGFVRMPLAHDQLKITVIHREPFVVIFPEGHPLSETKQIRLAQLHNERFVLYGRRWAPGFFDTILRMCNAAGFSPNIVQETGEMYTSIALVVAGAGIAILPQSVVLAQPRKVVVRPLPHSAGVSEIAIATARNNASSLVNSFVSLAESVRKRRQGANGEVQRA